MPGFLRQPWGEGWALVSDTSHFKDPISAHGITDGLRDAELLADAIDAVIHGASSERNAFGGYQEMRDRLTLELALTDEVASFRWDLARIRDLLVALSKAMKAEVEALNSLDQPGVQCATGDRVPGSTWLWQRTAPRATSTSSAPSAWR